MYACNYFLTLPKLVPEKVEENLENVYILMWNSKYNSMTKVPSFMKQGKRQSGTGLQTTPNHMSSHSYSSRELRLHDKRNRQLYFDTVMYDSQHHPAKTNTEA